MAQYPLARGTTWRLLVTIAQNGVPINLTGHHVMATVRLVLVDGTTDATVIPIWQGDNMPPGSLGGVVLLTQSGSTVGQCIVTMPASATQVLPNPIIVPTLLYYDITDNDGSGGIWETESGNIRLTPRTGLVQP
jgi:hypothetical protein